MHLASNASVHLQAACQVEYMEDDYDEDEGLPPLDTVSTCTRC
jgi:hypothetical protein